MARALLTARVSDLEHRVDAIGRRFDGLDAQILQFREDMRIAHVATNSRIDDLRTEVTASKVEFQQRFDGLEQRFDGLEQRFDGFQQRFDGLEQRFDGLEQRFDGLEQRFDGLEQRFDGLEQRFDETHARIDRGDEETRRYMRVLHEEVIERLQWIKNG